MNDQDMIKAMEHYYGIPADMCDVFMRAAWQASWKASREVLVIELPHPLEYTGCSTAIKDCREAIEAAGVKVKV